MSLKRKSALLLASAMLFTLAVPAVGQPERGIEVGQGIEPREMKTIEREKVLVPDPDGLTALVFWATWSPRSVKALELWQKFGQQYAENGVTVITVNADKQNMGSEEEGAVRQYITDNEVTLPVIVDTQLELFNEIGVIVLPTTFLFKPDGTLDYKYPGFPTSAELDLKEDLEAKLGIAAEPAEGEDDTRGKLAYQPKNNALLFYNMGRRIHEKGFPEKGKAKYIEALQKDPDYEDPLRALEDLFFEKGRTPDAEERLHSLLTASGLEVVIEKISPADEQAPQPAGKAAAVEPDPAPAGTAKQALTPMERMKLLMEKKGN